MVLYLGSEVRRRSSEACNPFLLSVIMDKKWGSIKAWKTT